MVEHVVTARHLTRQFDGAWISHLVVFVKDELGDVGLARTGEYPIEGAQV